MLSRSAVCARWVWLLLAVWSVGCCCSVWVPGASASCEWAPADPSASSSLSYDRSALRLLLNDSASPSSSSAPLSYYVEYVTSDCHHCAYQWLYSSGGAPTACRAGRALSYCSLSSRHTLTLRLIDANTFNDSTDTKDVLATAHFELTERGYYTLLVQPAPAPSSPASPALPSLVPPLSANGSTALTAHLLTDKAGDSAYVALFIVFPVLFVLLLICRALCDERVVAPLRAAYARYVQQSPQPAAIGGGWGSGSASTTSKGAVEGRGGLHEPMLANSSEEDEAAQLMKSTTPTSYSPPLSSLDGGRSGASAAATPRIGDSAVAVSEERAKAVNADGPADSPLWSSSPAAAAPAPALALAPSSSSLLPSSTPPLHGLVARRIRGKERLLSLDTFRGLALSVMIFVNYGGGGYWFFEHAEWNGLTVADLVFPMFVWMMGASMPLSLQSLDRRGVGRREMTAKVVRRSFILFMLGLAVSNGGTTLAQMRVMGVLQRFACSYLIVGLILLYSPKLGVGREGLRPVVLEDGGAAGEAAESDEPEQRMGQSKADRWGGAAARLLSHPSLREHVHHCVEYGVVLLLLLIHLLVTFTLPVPSCPTGYLGPGGLADGGQYPGCVGGAAGYIDRQLLGYAHIYHNPTCSQPYRCGAFDPEGLLGILTSAALCYMGVIAGRSILWHKEPRTRVARWLLGMAVCGLLALALCGGRQEGGWIPVNKNLWSLSFILTLSCFSFALLSALYLLIDVARVWDGAPFRSMGQNSILMYHSQLHHTALTALTALVRWQPLALALALIRGFSPLSGLCWLRGWCGCSYFLSEGLNRMWPFAWRLDGGDPNTHLTNLTEHVGTVVAFWAVAAYAAHHQFFIAI